MTRNVDRPILDLLGQPVREGERVITVGFAAANALVSSNDGDGAAKAARYRLAMRLTAGGDAELSPEDLVAIRAAVGSHYLPLVVGQVFDWCDPAEPGKGA